MPLLDWGARVLTAEATSDALPGQPDRPGPR